MKRIVESVLKPIVFDMKQSCASRILKNTLAPKRHWSNIRDIVAITKSSNQQRDFFFPTYKIPNIRAYSTTCDDNIKLKQQFEKSTTKGEIAISKINDVIEATEEEVKKIKQELMDFNMTKVPYHKIPPWTDINYILKDKDNSIITGITSSLIMDNILSIDTLFVAEKYRGQGYGSMMLSKVEQDARKRGAYMITLSTFSFQGGLELYKRHGYEIFATLSDQPIKGETQYYLKKYIKVS